MSAWNDIDKDSPKTWQGGKNMELNQRSSWDQAVLVQNGGDQAIFVEDGGDQVILVEDDGDQAILVQDGEDQAIFVGDGGIKPSWQRTVRTRLSW